MIHEQVHCEQYHSIDILIIEFIKILLWFNPLIWIFKKEIQLIHEYLADNAVILKHDRKNYQNLILNIVFRNNSTYLASNFNYSLTKKRLIMMTKNNSWGKSMVRKIAIVPLVLILAITMTFSQENLPKDSLSNIENEWWYPILKKHHIELQTFNNFENVFEMGTTNSINDKIVTLKNALFIIKKNADKYDIIRSPLAYHDLKRNGIKADKGSIETYSFDSKDLDPIETLRFTSMDVKLCEHCVWIMDDKGKIITITAE